jgi:hypothetical protein
MKHWMLAGAATAFLALPSCTRHTVRLEPIEIKPIHITMDINIKIQKQLEQDFAFMGEPAEAEGEKKPKEK